MTITVERLIGFQKAKAAKKAEREDIVATAKASLGAALEGQDVRLHGDIARAHIDCWIAFLAGHDCPLEAMTHLAGIQGRLAPAIEAPKRAGAAADAVFGGSRR